MTNGLVPTAAMHAVPDSMNGVQIYACSSSTDPLAPPTACARAGKCDSWLALGSSVSIPAVSQTSRRKACLLLLLLALFVKDIDKARLTSVNDHTRGTVRHRSRNCWVIGRNIGQRWR